MTWDIRLVVVDDAPSVAAVHRRSRETAMPWLPELHTPEEDVAFFTSQISLSTGWVAVEDEAVIGFALVRDGWLNHLYIDNPSQGAGVGSALLAKAKETAGQGMQLWAFQRNARALDFYARRGLVEVERTDGSGNEEREPDVRLRWAEGQLGR